MPASKTKGSVATTRLRKAGCLGCEYVIRVSRKWMAVGLPTCPCGQAFECFDDMREECELREFEERWARTAEREARKEMGGLSYEERSTCEWCGGFVLNRDSECLKCGHRPDLAIGHRNIPNRRKPAMAF